ncbi:MAG: helix-turn-helix transcriptional regulator [PVC group bacterium]|nr:helix-turn-helix transcriptional regulator [PVC group bacterium]
MNKSETIQLLKKLRKEKKITIIELAAKMGVGQDYIARLENGSQEATIEQIEVIKSFIEQV